MIKKLLMPAIMYLIALIIIISGVFAGVWDYRHITSKSYIKGDLSGIDNVLMSTELYFNTNQLTLYEVEDADNQYLYTIDLTPIKNFNGLTKKYEVVFNGNEVINAKVGAGYVEFSKMLEFLSVNNEILSTSKMVIQVSMLADKTRLKVFVETDKIEYMTQYFNNNSFALSIRQTGGVKWVKTKIKK